MRQIVRWWRGPRHVRWLALIGILLPWLAVRVLRARRGHHTTSHPRLTAHRGHRGGASRLQPGWCATNGATRPDGEHERTVEG
jgi:hypothetical protein